MKKIYKKEFVTKRGNKCEQTIEIETRKPKLWEVLVVCGVVALGVIVFAVL